MITGCKNVLNVIKIAVDKTVFILIVSISNQTKLKCFKMLFE